MHKRLVAGLSGLVTCLQSDSVGTNFRGLLFKLRRSQAFPFPLPLFPFGRLLAGSRRPDGAGNPTISGETETQVPAACQPRQPHMCIYYLFICLFSEMFEKIQMSWYSAHRNFFYVFWILIFCCLHESQILFYFVFDLFIFFTVSVAKQKFLILIDIYQSIRCLVFSFSL